MTRAVQSVTRLPRLAPRPAAMHKGQAGHVAIIAGSRGMSGAAVLCGLGALRGGAGLVRVFAPASVQAIVAAHEPSLMTAALGETEAGRLSGGALRRLGEQRESEWADVLAIGPGLGQDAELAAELVQFLASHKTPRVLDADALNMLAALPAGGWTRVTHRPTIVTPHPGEMERLRGGLRLRSRSAPTDDARVVMAVEFARRTRTVCVLKGHRTVVSDGRRVFVNTTGNPGMAAGGMGDVLTGLIAALVAQGLAPFPAACLGVHVHGAAADALAERVGPVGYLAREVAAELPAALGRVSAL